MEAIQNSLVDQTMLTFHPLLTMRAAIVAGVAAGLGLIALANLSISEPPSARVDEASLRAPVVARVVRNSFVVLPSTPAL